LFPDFCEQAQHPFSFLHRPPPPSLPGSEVDIPMGSSSLVGFLPPPPEQSSLDSSVVVLFCLVVASLSRLLHKVRDLGKKVGDLFPSLFRHSPATPYISGPLTYFSPPFCRCFFFFFFFPVYPPRELLFRFEASFHGSPHCGGEVLGCPLAFFGPPMLHLAPPLFALPFFL